MTVGEQWQLRKAAEWTVREQDVAWKCSVRCRKQLRKELQRRASHSETAKNNGSGQKGGVAATMRQALNSQG
jgi:hypothetical protein